MNEKGQTEKDKERTGTGEPEGKFVRFGGSGRRRSGGVSACVRKLERTASWESEKRREDGQTYHRASGEGSTNE